MTRTTIGTEAQFIRDFARYILPENLLMCVVDWIRDNLKPVDVFEEDALHEWATHAGYTKGKA